MPRGRPGHAGQKIAHLAPRATLGETLEEGAAGVHQRDDCRRKGFPEQQRRRHRQRRDDVEPDLALPQASDNLDAKRGKHRDDTGRPRDSGKVRLPHQPKDEA